MDNRKRKSLFFFFFFFFFCIFENRKRKKKCKIIKDNSKILNETMLFYKKLYTKKIVQNVDLKKYVTWFGHT